MSPANDKQAKMLETVRALLAKAEATEFPQEADAFRAKADQLMTRFAIDKWMVDAAQNGINATTRPERRDFDRSWRSSKFRQDLFYMFSALAEHCRCAVGYRGQTYELLPVYGLPSDLDYLDMLYTSLALEVAKNLQPPVDPTGELGHEVFKQRQAGIAWPEITRKVYNAGLIKLSKAERAKLNERLERWGHAPILTGEPEWDKLYQFEPVWSSMKNRLANANRRYVKAEGLDAERNYVKPEVYQRSFMLGFADEIVDRIHKMSAAARAAYDAEGKGESFALAVRDVKSQAVDLYNSEFPPPPPSPVTPGAKSRKLPKLKEVAVDYSAMSAGRSKARDAELGNKPGNRVRSTPELPFN